MPSSPTAGCGWCPIGVERCGHGGRPRHLSGTIRGTPGVIRQSTAFLLTQALARCLRSIGTAAGFSPGRPAAGKTGTSDGNRDAWFAGYTPELVAVVHMGYDRGRRPLPGSGGSLAAPIWTDFVRRALHDRPAQEFPVPDGVKALLVCGETGDLAGPGCPAGPSISPRARSRASSVSGIAWCSSWSAVGATCSRVRTAAAWRRWSSNRVRSRRRSAVSVGAGSSTGSRISSTGRGRAVSCRGPRPKPGSPRKNRVKAGGYKPLKSVARAKRPAEPAANQKI